MNKEFTPIVAETETETEAVEFKLGDKVIYTDSKGNEKNGKVTRVEGDLHLGEGLAEITFDDGSVECVPVKDLKIVELDEESE